MLSFVAGGGAAEVRVLPPAEGVEAADVPVLAPARGVDAVEACRGLVDRPVEPAALCAERTAAALDALGVERVLVVVRPRPAD